MNHQVQLLQEYVSVLQRQNMAKNKQRQTLYTELQHLQNTLKNLQQQLTQIKLTQSIHLPSPPKQSTQQPQLSIQSLKSRIRDLQEQIEILKYEQQHLFEENLSLINALQGTVNQNNQLQKQNTELKSQKQELQKFRLAIERISASLQEIQTQRLNLTEANMVLVQENSYLKGVLAGSSSSYRQKHLYLQDGRSQGLNSQSNVSFPATNNINNYPPMVKSSYLMTNSIEKISEYQQEYEDSTQGGGSKRKHRFLGSQHRKSLTQRDNDRNNEFMYDENGDYVNENDESSYLMVMDQKSKQSMRVSCEQNQQAQSNQKNIYLDNNSQQEEAIQGIRISNFDRVKQQESSFGYKNDDQKYKISSRRSGKSQKRNDESSCDVVQEQYYSQNSRYQQSNKPNDRDQSNKEINCGNQKDNLEYQMQKEGSSQTVLKLTMKISELEQKNSELQSKATEFQEKNIQLEEEMQQIRQQYLSISQQRNLFEKELLKMQQLLVARQQQLIKNQQQLVQVQQQLNQKQAEQDMTNGWWENQLNQLTNDYNSLLQHAQLLEHENNQYQLEIKRLQQIVNNYEHNKSNKNYSLSNTQKYPQNRQARFSFNSQQSRPYRNHRQQTQNLNKNCQSSSNYSSSQSVSSMKQLKQIDTNSKNYYKANQNMIDHKSLLKHNNLLIEQITEIQKQKNELYLNNKYASRNTPNSIYKKLEQKKNLKKHPQKSLLKNNLLKKSSSSTVFNIQQNKQNLMTNNFHNAKNQTFQLFPNRKQYFSQNQIIQQPIYEEHNQLNFKQNSQLNRRSLEPNFRKVSKKYNRANKNERNLSFHIGDSSFNESQNSDIQQVQNKLQRRIQRIKSQNQLLLKELQLF